MLVFVVVGRDKNEAKKVRICLCCIGRYMNANLCVRV